jgi:hypothetical protein
MTKFIEYIYPKVKELSISPLVFQRELQVYQLILLMNWESNMEDSLQVKLKIGKKVLVR